MTIFSTGDEVVPPATATLRPGQVRDASAVALAALVSESGGEPVLGGIVPDDPDALETAPSAALSSSRCDRGLGRLLGRCPRRDRHRGRPPGRAGHLVPRPGDQAGKPTLLADCAGVPVIGLPGNPRSALVVFRLIGMPLVRRVAGCTSPPAEPVLRARLQRDLASAAGRLDVVQVRVRDGVATPLFGLSALLSVLTAADGYVIVPEEATGLDAGTEVDVTLYR